MLPTLQERIGGGRRMIAYNFDVMGEEQSGGRKNPHQVS